MRPLAVNDLIIASIAGRVENEIPFGTVNLSKELQKTVIEIVPSHPYDNMAEMEGALVEGLAALTKRTPDYHYLGLGMHPLLRLEEAKVWDHEDKEIYDEYDRLFNIRQHGWLNIQALQVNLSYDGEEGMLRLYNRMRSLIPYLVALSAASPFVEGRRPGPMDNRLTYYRSNQSRFPEICNGIIPEKMVSLNQHLEAQEGTFRQLRAEGADVLCQEWLDSKGIILRRSRSCVEMKAIDEQECIRSDMAIATFLWCLTRPRKLEVEEDRDALLNLLEAAMQKGAAALRPELRSLLRAAWRSARPGEGPYLELVEERIENGSLAELIAPMGRDEAAITAIAKRLSAGLQANQPLRLKDLAGKD
jgi:hypothetical protein